MVFERQKGLSMKYLLTGGTGNLGQELQKHLECFAPTIAELNFESRGNVCGFLDEKCDAELADCTTIIHSGAYTNVPGAETDQRSAIEANIVGTKNISKLAKYLGEYHNRKIRVIYISSDYVYPGTTGNYDELSKTEPFNFYGFTKLAGEAYMDREKDLVVRTSFKPRNLWQKYDKAFTDVFTSADYVDVIAKDIALVIKSDLVGTINVAKERKSVYYLAIQTNPSVGQISRCQVSVKMPTDISMNIDKFLCFKQNIERQ